MDNINKQFQSIVSEISFGDKSIRQFFDESQEYQFGNAQKPMELSERKIKRDLVNSIRHNNSFDYNAGIYDVHKLDRKNRAENYKIYKNIILNMIAKEYPFLADECNNQKFRVDMVKIVDNT